MSSSLLELNYLYYQSEIGDPSRLKEYWSRDKYINIDVHADIDEAILRDEDVLRCTLMGRVLYLQMEENMLGSTVVFPHKQVDWKLIEDDNHAQGRVLRFPGGAMHAAPRPYYRWLSLVPSGDTGDEDNADIERSVLLFNTWLEQRLTPAKLTGKKDICCC